MVPGGTADPDAEGTVGWRIPLRLIFASLALTAASPSLAALTLVGSGCDETLPDPNANACAGAYAGNLNNNASIGDLNAALDVLAGGNFADVVFADLDPTKIFFSAGSGTTLNFAQTLFGEQSSVSTSVMRARV